MYQTSADIWNQIAHYPIDSVWMQRVLTLNDADMEQALLAAQARLPELGIPQDIAALAPLYAPLCLADDAIEAYLLAQDDLALAQALPTGTIEEICQLAAYAHRLTPQETEQLSKALTLLSAWD